MRITYDKAFLSPGSRENQREIARDLKIALWGITVLGAPLNPIRALPIAAAAILLPDRIATLSWREHPNKLQLTPLEGDSTAHVEYDAQYPVVRLWAGRANPQPLDDPEDFQTASHLREWLETGDPDASIVKMSKSYLVLAAPTARIYVYKPETGEHTQVTGAERGTSIRRRRGEMLIVTTSDKPISFKPDMKVSQIDAPAVILTTPKKRGDK